MVNPYRNMRFLVLNFWDTPMTLGLEKLRAMTDPASRQGQHKQNGKRYCIGIKEYGKPLREGNEMIFSQITNIRI